MVSLVLTDSSQLTVESFKKLPDQITFPYAKPDDLRKHEVAVKLESVRARHPQLLYESKLYKILHGGVGIPHISSTAEDGEIEVRISLSLLIQPSSIDLWEDAEPSLDFALGGAIARSARSKEPALKGTAVVVESQWPDSLWLKGFQKWVIGSCRYGCLCSGSSTLYSDQHSSSTYTGVEWAGFLARLALLKYRVGRFPSQTSTPQVPSGPVS
uniref:(California timema) hypothetical protein n=1 Tax=Timema californicum TaxID=61474 RepID=A0A7R9J6W9_TIMCA|nr:unnamed protein product [Timema californicum]